MKKSYGKHIRNIIFFAVALVLIVLLLEHSAKILYPVKYRDAVEKYAGEYGLDPFLVFSVIKVESSYRPDAVSPKNAKGLMQISDKTGKWAAEVLHIDGFTVEMLFDPDTNIMIGCWYLNSLFRQFDGSEETALAAYNAGSGNVRQWLQDERLSSNGRELDKIPFKETEKYLKRVKNCYSIYKKLYENHF